MADTIDNTADLGLAIRRARVAQGFTRDELALVTGLSPKFITQVEGGKPTAQIGKVLQLLQELGIGLSVHLPENQPGTGSKSNRLSAAIRSAARLSQKAPHGE